MVSTQIYQLSFLFNNLYNVHRSNTDKNKFLQLTKDTYDKVFK